MYFPENFLNVMKFYSWFIIFFVGTMYSWMIRIFPTYNMFSKLTISGFNLVILLLKPRYLYRIR